MLWAKLPRLSSGWVYPELAYIIFFIFTSIELLFHNSNKKINIYIYNSILYLIEYYIKKLKISLNIKFKQRYLHICESRSNKQTKVGRGNPFATNCSIHVVVISGDGGIESARLQATKDIYNKKN